MVLVSQQECLTDSGGKGVHGAREETRKAEMGSFSSCLYYSHST